MKELSIILVNWNCIAFTQQCLQSICDNSGDLDLEVIVIDNHSNDAPCAIVRERFPWVQLLLSDQNLGFGGANNLAAKHSSGQYLLFLNPDTVVLDDALQQMLSALKKTPKAGAVGCRLLNSDGTLQATCVQSFPTIANQLLALQWAQRRWPAMPLWGRQAAYANDPHKVYPVDFVSGAAVMVKRDVFFDVGGFNPAYFMYAEETELCLAIKKAGHTVCHTSAARIVHFGGQSTKNCEDSFAAITMRDSIYQFFTRNRGRCYALTYRLGLLASAAGRVALLTMSMPVAVLLRTSSSQRSILIALTKWISIFRWAIGLEGRGRGRSAIPSASRAGS